ncbi:hypothetical protein D1O90_004955 [Escherichia coli]|nr:hypothetical protein [Escherichia coli]
MNAWMLVIGLSAQDPSPAIAATSFATERDCKAVAMVVEQQSSAAGKKLYAKCSETIPVIIGPDGSVTDKPHP